MAARFHAGVDPLAPPPRALLLPGIPAASTTISHGGVESRTAPSISPVGGK